MMTTIKEVLELHDQVVLGTPVKTQDLEDKFLYVEKQDVKFLCIQNEQNPLSLTEIIDHYSDLHYLEKFVQHDNRFNTDQAGDLLFFLYILLDATNIYTKQSVNNRLKYFCVKNFQALNTAQISTSERADTMNLLLNKIFFCHPTNEEFPALFHYKTDDSTGTISLNYQDKPLDLAGFTNDYFNFILEDHELEYSSFKKIAGKKPISVLKKILVSLSNMLYVNKETAGSVDDYRQNLPGALYNGQVNLFSLYENKEFIPLLKSALPNYNIKSWEDQSEDVSIYYSHKKDKNIEKDFIPVNGDIDKRIKYDAEYLVDSSIICLFKKQTILLEVIKELADEKHLLKQLFSILFSHPFFNYHSRLAFVQSLPPGTDLPDGFWMEQINSLKAQE